MNARTHFGISSSILLTALSARAQTTFPEVEPNGQKFEATPVAGMVAGDTITGSSTGSSTMAGNALLNTADTFRVQTAAAPLAIYRHTLAVTTSGPSGYTGRLLGLMQLNGVILPTETTFQFSSNGPALNESTWYGFGKQEQMYYRVIGTAATTSAYTATLTTSTIAPLAIGGTFAPGPVTVTTVGQGHNSDTEIYVYDSTLTPVPLGHNDGLSGFGTVSSVTLTLAPGTYYAAVSSYNTANDQSDLNPTEVNDDETVLDFPDVIANNLGLTPYNVSFAVTDGTTTAHVPVLQSQAFEIVWATFIVGTQATVYCSGDGAGTACPCGNSGAAGNGCASSVAASGAHLQASGAASVTNDTFVLSGTNMPNGSALYYQGTQRTAGGAGAVFGDGLRCASGTVIRLGTKTNASGASSYPGAGNTPVSVKGMDNAGDVRDYQVWYRNATPFCTPSTFNLSNGVEITWMP
jgi:hypothetical protein